MATRIRWSPSQDASAATYRIETAAASAGPWSTLATVAHDLSGGDFDSTLGLFEHTHEAGTPSTWYRIVVVNGSDEDSAPSEPFQSTVLVSPPLADVDDVKAYLGVTVSTDDALIADLVEAASAYVESYTGQSFRYRLKVELRDGNGERSLRLREGPVVDVVGVSVDGVAVPESTSLSSDGWFLMDGSVRLRGSRFTPGDGNVSVSYTCGYPAVPADVRQCVVELASLKYRDRTRIGKSTEAISGMSVSYLPSMVPASVTAVLDAHRRLLWS